MANKIGKVENLTSYVKGTSGNRRGRPPKLPALDTLMAEILGEKKDGVTAMKVILMALRAKAFKGDIRAAEILFDRAYGRTRSLLEIEDVRDTQVIWLGPERLPASD